MAKRKALVYVRKDRSKVAVYENPVHGQLRFVAAKRTALDGKTWWVPYDNETGEYLFGQSKTRRECESRISWMLRKGDIPFVPYLGRVQYTSADGKKKRAKKEKCYAVDVYCTLVKCYKVYAEDAEDAEEKVFKKVGKILANPTPIVPNLLVNEGFEACEDAEVRCSGEGRDADSIEYN